MTQITLLCSKFSNLCHDILSQVPTSQLQKHLKVIWIDRKEYRDILSETDISTVPCIIVNDQLGNRVVYQGQDFTSYWNEFVKSLTRKAPNFLNNMHSNSMMHVDQINQSIQKLQQSIQSHQEKNSLLSQEEQTDGLQNRLLHHMNNFQQQPNNRPFQLNHQTNHIKEQSSLGNLRHQIEREHTQFKQIHNSLQNAQENNSSRLEQLKMANSLLQQTQPI